MFFSALCGQMCRLFRRYLLTRRETLSETRVKGLKGVQLRGDVRFNEIGEENGGSEGENKCVGVGGRISDDKSGTRG